MHADEDDDDALITDEARRRGYWMKLARNEAGVTVEDAAVAAGLAKTSGSSVTKWERGGRIRMDQMTKLARRYGVPVRLFTEPDPTDADRLASAIAEATRLALEDPLVGPDQDQPGAGAR